MNLYYQNLNAKDLERLAVITGSYPKVSFSKYVVSDYRYGHELLRHQTNQPLQMPPPPQEPPLNPERAILIQRVPHRQRKGGKGKKS